MQDHAPTPTDRIVYAGARVTIGAFRCPVGHPRFHDSGPAQGDISAEVEEVIVGLLARVLRHAYRAWQGVAPVEKGPRLGDAEIVERPRLALAKHYDEPVSLAVIAAACGVSHFRLCRVFRKRAGTTLHAYREQLLLRAALEALATPRADLTELALSLGYSSYSHFSANFRAAFGMTPSDVRRRATLKTLERPLTRDRRPSPSSSRGPAPEALARRRSTARAKAPGWRRPRAAR